jgi:hypothetical protein
MKLPPLVQTLLWMAAASECVRAQDRLTVAVFNYAGVPNSVLATAVEDARLMYHTAGLETAWPICDAVKGWPENCNAPLPKETSYLELLVMPRMIVPPEHVGRSKPAGYALTGGEFLRPRAYVFYDVTRNAAATAVHPLPLVLACVLVHESAHLLGLRHQTQGVMRANLDPRDMFYASMGRAFNTDEEKQLRAAVRRIGSRDAGEPLGTSGAVMAKTSAGKTAGGGSTPRTY